MGILQVGLGLFFFLNDFFLSLWQTRGPVQLLKLCDALNGAWQEIGLVCHFILRPENELFKQ